MQSSYHSLGLGQKKSYEQLYLLPKLHVPPNSNVCLNVLPNLFVRSYVCLSVLTNLYVRSYMRQNSRLLPNSDELIFAHTKKKSVLDILELSAEAQGVGQIQ